MIFKEDVPSSEFGFLPTLNTPRSTLLKVSLCLRCHYSFLRRNFGGCTSKIQFIFKGLAWKKKKKQTNKQKSQVAVSEENLKNSQATKNNLNSLHKLFFISKETGRLSVKVQ